MNYDSDSDSDSEMHIEDQNQLWILELINNLIEYDHEKHYLENKKFSKDKANERLNKKYKTELEELKKRHDKEKTDSFDKILQDIQDSETIDLYKKYEKIKKELNQKTIKETKISQLTEKHNAIKLKLIYEYVCSYVIECIKNKQEWKYEKTKEELTKSLNEHVKIKLFDPIIQDEYFKNYTDTYKKTLYKSIEEGFDKVILDYYKLNKIGIREIKILSRNHQCSDNMAIFEEECTIEKCLKNTNTLLFVTITIQNHKINEFNYHAVCYEKQTIQEWIFKNKQKVDCFTNDPLTYILLPIGPGGINVYIPLLSALMILQSDILIFYLIRDSEDSIYCDDDDKKSTPIYYIAQCGGKECAKKGWTGFKAKYAKKTKLSPIKKRRK